MSNKRNIAIVGPSLSGKTTLFENLLFASGAIRRKGTVKDGSTVGDSAPEARDRQVSTEVSAASTEHNGISFTFIDCPGSIEFSAEARNALMGVDAALVVCEPTPDRLMMLAPTLKFLDDNDIPHFVFVNKMDRANVMMREFMPAMRAVSAHPLVLQQVPIRDGEEISGYVELISDQAYAYQGDGASEKIAAPETVQDRKAAARTELLESLADFDDTLLVKLLEDEMPSSAEILEFIKSEVAENQVVPVFIGIAEHGNGVRRLLDHLAEMTPAPSNTLARRGIDAAGDALAQVLKTYMTPHGGKLSLIRVWRGKITDGITLNGVRVAGIHRMTGANQEKLNAAEGGDIVALGRLEGIATGDTLALGGEAPAEGLPSAAPLAPAFAKAITTVNRDDEVKLSAAIAKVIEEDPSLSVGQNSETHEFVMWGQGEIHIQVAIDRLRNKYNLSINTATPKVAYKEAIRKSTSQHGRFKRQTGGHGMFGDVHLDIKPLPRGAGFEFVQKIVGGSVPRQYIPAVEAGVRESLNKGPLGFPLVDVSVTLTDGAFHAVDSNEQSFKLAARVAMTEGIPNCKPVLLEPICNVLISVPNDATSKVHGVISGRRGQILGYQAKEGWDGWDEIEANMPQSELHDLIVELRSLTLGVGWYTSQFDHLTELTGRLASDLLARHAAETDKH